MALFKSKKRKTGIGRDGKLKKGYRFAKGGRVVKVKSKKK